MPPDRVLNQADQRAAAQRSGASVAAKNAIGLSIVLLLVFLNTATGFRSGSVWWLMAVVSQIVLITARLGIMSDDVMREALRRSGAYPHLLGLEVHPVFARVVLELYLALLLVLPFTTVFDDWVAVGP